MFHITFVFLKLQLVNLLKFLCLAVKPFVTFNFSHLSFRPYHLQSLLTHLSRYLLEAAGSFEQLNL
jgi:hypothetical protein